MNITREEAIRRIKAWNLDFDDMEVLSVVVPELTESDDERIRKELIGYLVHRADLTAFIDEGKDCKRWIAYLEKQKDIWRERAQNITANMLEDRIEGIQRELIEFLSNAVNASWVDIIQSANSYAERIRNIIEKQKEQKPVEYFSKQKIYDIMNKLTELSASNLIPIKSEEYVKIHEITSDVRSLLNYPVKQKPAEWSEEDNRILYNVISYIGFAAGQRGVKNNLFKEANDWLKSLPERFNIQPKQEWSKKEKDYYDAIIAKLEITQDDAMLTDNQMNFLKSLKPQPHWKPSKKQMEVFFKANPVNLMPEELAIYNSLCNDLKKLM